jgi:hypothetical protein
MTKIAYLLITLLLFVLGGCSKYQTKGKVDMSKLITLDELWEKREELKGKVVTVELDTIMSANYDGHSTGVELEPCHGGGFTTNTQGRWLTTFEQYDNYLRSIGLNENSVDTIFDGGYIFSIVTDSPDSFPSLKQYSPLTTKCDKKLIEKVSNSSQKIISGVLISARESYTFYKGKDLLITSRSIWVLPSGLKFSRFEKMKPLQ